MESSFLIQPGTKHLLPPTSLRTQLTVLTGSHEGLTRSPKAQQTAIRHHGLGLLEHALKLLAIESCVMLAPLQGPGESLSQTCSRGSRVAAGSECRAAFKVDPPSARCLFQCLVLSIEV